MIVTAPPEARRAITEALRAMIPRLADAWEDGRSAAIWTALDDTTEVVLEALDDAGVKL